MRIVKGPIVPMLTPFNEDNSVDETTLKSFTDWLISRNVSALFPIGGSGERVALNKEEKKLIMRIVIEKTNKRVPVWPGVGGSDLKETIELAQYARGLGADGVVVVIPREMNPSQEDLFNYYKEIDESIDIPIYIYEPGGYAPYSITPELFKRLAELPHIAGIRHSSKIIFPKLDYFLKFDKREDHPVTYITFTSRKEATGWLVLFLKEYTLVFKVCEVSSKEIW